MLPEATSKEQTTCNSSSVSPWDAAASSHALKNPNQFSSALYGCRENNLEVAQSL